VSFWKSRYPLERPEHLVHLTTSGSVFKGYSTTNAARRATVKARAEGPEGQYFSRLPCRVECV